MKTQPMSDSWDEYTHPAQEISPFSSDISDATYNEVSDNEFPMQRRRLLEALKYLEKLTDNWNGVEAISPTRQSISMAEHFVSYLFLTKLHADFIEPDGDGGIILKWEKEDLSIFLNIDGTAMHLSREERDCVAVYVDDEPFFDLTNKILPNKILQYIPNRRMDSV